MIKKGELYLDEKKSKLCQCKITQNLNKNNDEMNYF